MLMGKKEAETPVADLSLSLLDANYFTDDNSAAYINHVTDLTE